METLRLGTFFWLQIAHVPGNQFYCSPGTRINCPYSGYHELLPLCPRGRHRRALSLCYLFFGGNSRGYFGVLLIPLICISASLIGNRIGIFFLCDSI